MLPFALFGDCSFIYLKSDDVSSFSSRNLFSAIILVYIPLHSLALSFYTMEDLHGFIPHLSHVY